MTGKPVKAHGMCLAPKNFSDKTSDSSTDKVKGDPLEKTNWYSGQISGGANELEGI